jgi:hypothetical protein
VLGETLPNIAFSAALEALIYDTDQIEKRILCCRNRIDDYKNVSALVGLNERRANSEAQLNFHCMSFPRWLDLEENGSLEVEETPV